MKREARRYRVLSSVCLSVCLSVCFFFFPRDISKSAAVRITKLDTEMSHHDSGKSIYFGVKRSKVKVTRHKNTAGMNASSSSYRYYLRQQKRKFEGK